MKKLLSVLLVIFLLASVPLAAFAQEASGEPQLIVSTVQAMPGEEVSLTITLLNNPGIGVLNPKFVFDETVLEWIGYEQGGLTGWTVTKRAGVWLGNADSEFNGVILTLRFKVLDSAAGGFTEVSLICKEGDAYNYAEQPIFFHLVSGGVQVGAQSPEPSPSSSPEPAQGSISAPEATAPQVTAAPQPTSEVPSPSAVPSTPAPSAAGSEPTPVPEAGMVAASPVQDVPAAVSLAPEPTPEKTAGTRSFPVLPVVLSACVLALLILFLVRKNQAREKH